MVQLGQRGKSDTSARRMRGAMRTFSTLLLAFLAISCGYRTVPHDAGVSDASNDVRIADVGIQEAAAADTAVERDAHSTADVVRPALGNAYPFAFPVGPAGGGLSGSYPNPTIVASGITPGTVGQFYMTLAGPTAGWASQSGDVSGSAVTPGLETVLKINGATVPAAGALTTGNMLQVSGASALTYAPVNLAGGAGFVTGTLPAGSQAAQTMSGDVTGTTAASIVSTISGTAPVNVVNAAMSFGATPALSGTLRLPNNTEAVVARNGANSADVELLATSNTDVIFIGNNASLIRFRPGSAVDAVDFATTSIQLNKPIGAVSGTPVQFAATSGAISTAANITLSAAQIATPIIQLNGTAGNITVTLPNTVGGIWYFDFTNVTIGASTVTFTTGSGTTDGVSASTLATGKHLITCVVAASNFVSCG
jgi:hypothetical protein